jgi:hypothetical protein
LSYTGSNKVHGIPLFTPMPPYTLRVIGSQDPFFKISSSYLLPHATDGFVRTAATISLRGVCWVDLFRIQISNHDKHESRTGHNHDVCVTKDLYYFLHLRTNWYWRKVCFNEKNICSHSYILPYYPTKCVLKRVAFCPDANGS